MLYEDMYQIATKIGITRVDIGKHVAIPKPPYMTLHVDGLLVTDDGRERIAIAHNYVDGSGDLVPDPDMEIIVDHENGTLEAATYQDTYTYRTVYPAEGKVDTEAKRQLNSFLYQWLRRMVAEGYNIEDRITETNDKEIGTTQAVTKPETGEVTA